MKEKITTYTLSLFLIIVFLLNIITKDNYISISERRKLYQFPKIDTNFTNKFENYALDQFIFRDKFRSTKSYFNIKILNKLDNNNLFKKDDYIYSMNYKIDYKSIDRFTNIVNSICSKYFINNKVYYSIIPEKNYYLTNDIHLKYDYNSLYNTVNKNLSNLNYINITNILNLNDYYYTDTHWKQENLIKLVDKLSKQMNFDYTTEYLKNIYNNFKGVYYSQLSLSNKTDELVYLTNDIINKAHVYNIESDTNTVYNKYKLDSFDPYDIYLNGASAIINITNNESNNKNELIIFRDSFSSSLVPLLISSYYKITLIDLRYTTFENALNYINIENQDILFIYSTLIINNSYSLKDK